MKKQIVIAVLALFLAGNVYAQGKGGPGQPKDISKEVVTCNLSADLADLLNKCETAKPRCCAGQYACNLRDRYYNICNDKGEWREGGKLPQDLAQMDADLKQKCDQAPPKCCTGQYGCNYRDRYFNVCGNGEWRAGGQIAEELMAFRSKCDWKNHLRK